ncbi:MAG: M28 family peptidase [Spirochaetes bacterium]|nr:M28 family peptidase [Spirochaetota bacterium]
MAKHGSRPKQVSAGRLDPMDVVRELARLPHRGATTPQAAEAANLLERRLKGMGASVRRHTFLTPRTYIPVLGWFLAGLVVGLLLGPAFRWIGLAITAASAVTGLLFLDWRWTPLMLLPPLGRAENLVARHPSAAGGGAPRTLILMAHYDSAPVSLLYLPSMVKSFRQSLFVSLGVIVLTVIVSALMALQVGPVWVRWLRWPLCAYFAVQGVLASLDFFRFGYTNGAADNATGVGVALATASRLWNDPPPGWQVEVLLTSAEEASLVGSIAYVRAHGKELDTSRTFVVNFDGLGAGDVRIVHSTGFITASTYDNPLVHAAMETARRDSRFASVTPVDWHVGDFDSVSFLRRGYACLSLSAVTKEGVMPHLHRPDDVLANVDSQVPALAVDFAEAAIRRFSAKV